MKKRTVPAEANLLQLPFALVDPRCPPAGEVLMFSGEGDDGECRFTWTYRLSKSPLTEWPGPESRAVHLAFLSIIKEQAKPFTNPLTWHWHDLCRRMGRVYSGQTVQDLKSAILATANLTIRSDRALWLKSARRRIKRLTRLYTEVWFVNTERDDGTVSDKNALWFSKWYLTNLNALYTAPIDHDLWRYLHKARPIASRLYEILIYGNTANNPALKMRYTVLADRLPVKKHTCPAKVRQQLEEPLKLLKEAGVLSEYTLEPRKDCVSFITLIRGPALSPNSQTDKVPGGPVEQGLSQERQLIDLWYSKRFPGRPVPTFPPSDSELQLAATIIKDHGGEAKLVVTRLASLVGHRFKRGERFGSCVTFYQEVSAGIKAEKQRQRAQAEERERQAREREEQARRQQELAYWERLWDEVACLEWKEQIKEEIITRQPGYARLPNTLKAECVREVQRLGHVSVMIIDPGPRRIPDPEVRAGFRKMVLMEYPGVWFSDN